MEEMRTYTKEGYDALVNELEFYKAEREKNKKEISEARSYGDLSENSEYDEAKNNQTKIAMKIEELEDQLKHAIIQDEDAIDYSKVSVGSIVTCFNHNKNQEFDYRIVGSYEADPFNNLISDESPIGVALRGHSAGETVTVELPNGKSYALDIKKVEHRAQKK